MLKKFLLITFFLCLILFSESLAGESLRKLQNEAVIYYNGGCYRASIMQCDRLIERDPKSAWAYNMKGSMLTYLFQYRKAEQIYHESLKICDKHPDYRKNEEIKYLTLLNLGMLHEGREEYDKALECYRKAAKENPGAATIAEVQICKMWISQGRKDAAERLFKKIIKKIPNVLKEEGLFDRGKTFAGFAHIAYGLGKKKMALEYAKKCYELRKDPQSRIVYASYLILNGRGKEARELMKKLRRERISPLVAAEYYAIAGDVKNCIMYLQISKSRIFTGEALSNWKKQFKRRGYPDMWEKMRSNRDFQRIME